MRIFAVVSALALIVATATLAQTSPTAAAGTATRTFDNDRASRTTTITRDREAGSFNRDTRVIHKSDGRTSGGTYERTRTDTGFTESGTINRRNGTSYALNGSLVRGGGSAARNRVLSNAQGNTVASRNVLTSPAQGSLTRITTTTGPHGAGRGRRG